MGRDELRGVDLKRQQKNQTMYIIIGDRSIKLNRSSLISESITQIGEPLKFRVCRTNHSKIKLAAVLESSTRKPGKRMQTVNEIFTYFNY